MAQRIYRITELRPVQDVPGRARAATEADRELLVAWVGAFAAESMPEGAPDRGAERTVDARLRAGSGSFTIWEDDGPVSLAGWGGRRRTGARIGPVYTPPEHRGRGYGSAVTAAVTAEQLAAGRTFCFLYTDLANPTSNKIYTDMGYEPVCDAVDYAFEPDGPLAASGSSRVTDACESGSASCSREPTRGAPLLIELPASRAPGRFEADVRRADSLAGGLAPTHRSERGRHGLGRASRRRSLEVAAVVDREGGHWFLAADAANVPAHITILRFPLFRPTASTAR